MGIGTEDYGVQKKKKGGFYILCHVPVFLRLYFFKRSFRITAKSTGKYRDFPICSLLPTCTPSPPVSIPHQRGTFVTKDPPPHTHHHLNPIVYLRVHFWFCTFYGFGKTYNDTHSSLQQNADYVHYSKSPLGSTYSSLPNSDPW